MVSHLVGCVGAHLSIAVGNVVPLMVGWRTTSRNKSSAGKTYLRHASHRKYEAHILVTSP
jgi:hypothetical protein